ncbi:MAG: hypothetical protein ABL868_05090, partial [Sulfuriferula sp.]
VYSDTILLDRVLPTGTVAINGGAATTALRDVVLSLTATDTANAVTGMRFSWDGITWLAWETYAPTRNIQIPAGANGTKTIRVQFRDAAGNISTPPATDSIQLADMTPPTGSVVINGGAAVTNVLNITLTMSAIGATETQYSWDGITWGGWLAYVTTRNLTMPAGADGVRSIYVRFRNASGIVSAVYSDTILLDRAAPTGSVVINGGAATTSVLGITLTLNATGATQTQYSWDGITWGNWLTYVTTRSLTMPAGADGVRSIYVRFRNASGVASAVYSDTILLERLTGSVVINGGAATTNVLGITLTMNAPGATETQYSWDGITWGGWLPYVTTRNLTMSAGSAGVRSIYVHFRNASGVVSVVYSDTINYAP